MPPDHTAIPSITVSAIRSHCHQITLPPDHSAIRSHCHRSHCHTFHYSFCHQITLPSDHTAIPSITVSAIRSHCHQITLPYPADNPCLMKGKRGLSRRNSHKRRAITIPGGERGGEEWGITSCQPQSCLSPGEVRTD